MARGDDDKAKTLDALREAEENMATVAEYLSLARRRLNERISELSDEG